MFVRDWLARRAVLSGDKIAITDFASGASLTYRQLDERAIRLANYLRDKCKVRTGERIAILSTNRTEILEAFFAAAKLTAVLVPLNHRLTASELHYILKDCEPRVTLYEYAFASTIKDLQTRGIINHVIEFDDAADDTKDDTKHDCYERALADSHAEQIEVAAFDAEMPLLVIYTSGTTGRPKGAILSHRMIAWNSFNTHLAWNLTASDVTTCHAPLFHTGGFNVLTLPLLHAGAKIVMLPCFDAHQVLQAIEQHACTIFFGVPTMFQMMLESPRFASTNLSSIRYFISGGAPCPVPLIKSYQRHGISFLQGYGLTEVGPNCFTLDANNAMRKAGSIGFPTMHSAARLVNETGDDVDAAEVGELWLRGGHTCSGYWRNEAATQTAFSDGWFRTGDLARRDTEGFYYIVGRAKDLIISGGENIYPAEVEAVLHAHPLVAAAAVIGITDDKWGEVPVAFIIARQQVTATEVTEFCESRLARYKTPKRIFFVDDFPLSASGKIIKRQLKNLIEQNMV